MKRILLLLVVLLAVGVEAALAQARKVSGKVLDEKNQGLPGAGILIKGTQAGTVTDIDGNFQLDVPQGSNTLVIQSVGYITQEVSVGGGSLTIKMQPTSRELTGTVVTALAVRREKRDIGYSATTLTSDDLNSGNNVSPLSAIQGKTAGVNITSTTGGPGGSTRVVLRGEKSIGGNNNALIVIDGVPMNNSSRDLGRDERSQIDFGNRGNDVNPEDIESITVLKGPAAAALYGSQAANGAIMITTKSGKGRKANGKTSVTYQTSYTLSNVLKLPDFQNEYGQGDRDNIADDRRENFSWGLPFDGQYRPWGQVINGQQKTKPYSALPDNVKNFFNTGTTWENNVSLGGSTDKGSYYLSLNALNNNGVIPHTFYDKYSIRLNASMDLPNKMYSNISLNYINIYSRVEETGQGQGSVYDNVLQQPRDIPITELKNLNDPFNAYGTKDANGIAHYGYYGAYSDNPYFLADKADNRNRTDHIVGSTVIGIRPNSHWDIFDRVGIDVISDRTTEKQPKYDYVPYDPFYVSAGQTQNRTSNGGYFNGTSSSVNFFNDFIVNYTNQLSEDFNFTGLAGANFQSSRATTLSGNIDYQTNGLVIPDYYNLGNAKGAPDLVDDISEVRQVSLYGSARIDYRRMLFLELTGRNDWASTLAASNRAFFYPSTSLSWVFTENMKGGFRDRILTYGKLRASYASVGNGAAAYQNNNPAYIRSSAATGFGLVKFPFNGTTGFGYTNIIGNEGLRPERTNSYEVGAELGFFNGRATVEATYYNNLSIDQIISVPTPPSSGFTARVINLGDISNKGLELQVRVTPVSTKTGFRWELFGTYTKNTNKVERLAEGVNQIAFGGISGMTVTATVGKPFGAFYGTDVATDPQGHVIVDSATGMPRIGANTVYKGTYQPRFIASWGTTLKYKGFALNVLFDTKQGGVFFSRTKDIMDFNGTAAETGKRDDYVFPNSVYVNSQGQYVTNTNTFHPYDWYTNVIPSGQHIVDASYVKLREASLYYTLPEKWLSRTFIGGVQVGVFGNNLFIWTAKDNKYSDPEMNSGASTNLQGFDYTSRPSLRNYGATVRVTF